MNLFERFEAVKDEDNKFDRVKNKRSKQPNLHALILLDELFPSQKSKAVCSAKLCEIWLVVKTDRLDKLTDQQILELVRCGVRYDNEVDCLSMFVW